MKYNPVILIFRTVAIWGGSRPLCIFFLAFALCVLGPIGFLSVKTLGHFECAIILLYSPRILDLIKSVDMPSIKPELLACVEAGPIVNVFYIDYILVAVFESRESQVSLCCLFIYKPL